MIPRLRILRHRFSVKGLNLERFLNLMKQQEIPLLSVQRVDGRTLLCECLSADVNVISTIAAEKGWLMEVVCPLGLSAVWRRLKKRPGLPAGLLVMLACTLIFSQFVWRIRIVDAGPYQADLVSFLQESGYHAGIRRSNVDARALENALIHRYPDIAWFHAYVTNTTLVVEVSPGVTLPQTPDDAPGDVVARENGIIHSLLVTAGTPVVKAGDVVQKGDVLIRGEERSADEQRVSVHASGVVMARCWHSETAGVPLYEVISTETGRQTTQTRLHTPWFDWPPVETPDYLASNIYLSQQPVAGAFFPVTWQTVIHREVSMEYALRPVEEVRQEAAKAALKRIKTRLFDDEIIDKWVDYCMIEDDILAATVTAERLVDIGEFSSP